ncbi:Pol protein [Phytophthora palmivora]|uniref:Pol protein n=1 Tax=Phytophthora palmivora TaxID=4796 RepID=A0A2P4YHM5_9STRA|nr:Pol protein [Phytophthora palmivora]
MIEIFVHSRAEGGQTAMEKKQEEEQASLIQRRTELTESAPLLVRIKQGQDETPVGGGGDDALLVSRTSVEALNDVIQLHGKDQVGILGRIKDFRKKYSAGYAELALPLSDLLKKDADWVWEQQHQDAFDSIKASLQQAPFLALPDENESFSAKLAHLGRHHQTSLLKLERTGSQLERQLRERERENQSFQQQVGQLETQVQIREDILASRTSAAMRQQEGGYTDHASLRTATNSPHMSQRMARWLSFFVEYLRLELDKMRRRTFPSFAQAHAREYHEVD